VADDQTVTETERSASVTGLGTVLGFSLTFIALWSLGPGKWRLVQALALCIAVPGVVLQLRSLLTVLSLPRISLESHRIVVMRRFVWGVALVLMGFAAHVAFDVLVDVFGLNLP
jgi:hypothetical protein